YSYIGSLVLFIGSCTVQGFVHVAGSSTVNSYISVSASTRVNRSTRCIFGLAFRKFDTEKLIVSTTSVSPSQRPRESPAHCRMRPCGRPSSGTIRELWIISFSSKTVSFACAMWTLLLYALGSIGGPELKPSRQRSLRFRSSGPLGGAARRFATAAFRACASAVSGGIFP